MTIPGLPQFFEYSNTPSANLHYEEVNRQWSFDVDPDTKENISKLETVQCLEDVCREIKSQDEKIEMMNQQVGTKNLSLASTHLPMPSGYQPLEHESPPAHTETRTDNASLPVCGAATTLSLSQQSHLLRTSPPFPTEYPQHLANPKKSTPLQLLKRPASQTSLTKECQANKKSTWKESKITDAPVGFTRPNSKPKRLPPTLPPQHFQRSTQAHHQRSGSHSSQSRETNSTVEKRRAHQLPLKPAQIQPKSESDPDHGARTTLAPSFNEDYLNSCALDLLHMEKTYEGQYRVAFCIHKLYGENMEVGLIMDLNYRLPDSVTIQYENQDKDRKFIMLKCSVEDYYALVSEQSAPVSIFQECVVSQHCESFTSTNGVISSSTEVLQSDYVEFVDYTLLKLCNLFAMHNLGRNYAKIGSKDRWSGTGFSKVDLP